MYYTCAHTHTAGKERVSEEERGNVCGGEVVWKVISIRPTGGARWSLACCRPCHVPVLT